METSEDKMYFKKALSSQKSPLDCITRTVPKTNKSWSALTSESARTSTVSRTGVEEGVAKMTEEDIEGGATVGGKSIRGGGDKTSSRMVVEDVTSGMGWGHSKHSMAYAGYTPVIGLQ